MSEPPPLPPLDRTFNVGEDCERFEEYIRELREDLRDPSRAPPLENHPNLYRLRPTSREPRQWLRLRMVAGNDEITVLVRTDDLYVVGFEQVHGARYEFGSDPDNDPKEKNKKDKEKKAKKKKKEKEEQEEPVRRQHLIRGATWLGFGGGYDNLGQPQPEPTQDTPTLPDLGWRPLEQAIHGLAAYTTQAPGAVRDWLRTIIITVSESLRLHNVCQHIGDLLRRYTSGWLTQRLMDCIHDWGDLSACVVLSATHPEVGAHELYRHLAHICENTDQACDVVAILKGTDDNEPGPSNRRPKRDATGDGDDDGVPMQQGLTFVEIFSAVVLRHGSTGRINSLYGHIAIDDRLSKDSSQVLFLPGRPSPSSNAAAVLLSANDDGHHQLVKLSGPARAVWGYGEVVMHVDLMNAIPGAVADMTPDSDEVGSGKLVWNTYDTPRMVYDEVEEYVFDGVSGAVSVRCAVITNAVVATVALSYNGRRRWDQKQKDVYGTVSAATAMFGPQDKVTLFDREWNDAVSVGAGEGVPLCRNVAVVPLRSPLTIYADLWTRAHVADMSADNRISSGAVVVFQSSPFGVVRKVIGGSSDYDFEVSVTWSFN